MKKNFISIAVMIYTICFCLVSENTLAQIPLLNQKSTDNRGNEMLTGKCTRQALMQDSFKDWFIFNYDSYTVDSFTCTFIKPLLANKTVTIFLGTWCGDSKREVPRILKMLDCCGFPESRLTLVMVSNHDSAYKKSPQHEEAGRNIVRVPTVIVEENGKEVGRIIEYPVVSLEKDMLTILRKEKYVPNYQDAKINAK
jgi:thiol-disulfide isomerase/thioredoxin